MSKGSRLISLARGLTVVGAAAALGLGVLLSSGIANAATLTSASMTLSDSRPSQAASYTFNASGFTTATSLQCIEFQFNTAADMTGSVPGGFTSTSAGLSSSTLVTASNWTVSAGTNGTVKLTYATGQTPASSGNIVLGSITNGSTAGTAYFVKVSTYSDSTCSTGADNVTVGFIYTSGEAVSATISPTLAFTVGSVASSTSVNGATTNVSTTSSTI
ncbi:MAG: hypothetical protein ACREHG_01015, partial [Candidatus Saccharimonadales bacterium]